jgi:hypothetical protein
MAGADAKSAAGSGPTTAAKTPCIVRANSIRYLSGARSHGEAGPTAPRAVIAAPGLAALQVGK